MGDAVVRRWRRYGKDRLYVHAEDGTTLGWHDLITGEDQIEVAEQADNYYAAVASWKQGLRPRTPTTQLAKPQSRMSTANVSTGPAQDLATQRAGALARQQAIALKEAAPVRPLLARVLHVHTEERAWRIGADGEQKVAAQLNRLSRKDARWLSLHSVPAGRNGSDIDHVVIGPGGVFTLNAKHHPGANVWIGGDTFMVNGSRQPYIRNSGHEALRAARFLSNACGFPVPVTGVVVPVGADRLTIKTPPQDVRVVNRMALVNWFRKRPITLADTTISVIFDAARRSTTRQPVA